MKKLAFIAVLASMVIGIAGLAFAVPATKKVEFDGKAAGKAIFDGKTHADAGLKCNACHPKIFKTKSGADKFTMADMKAGKSCGECHNGTKAFGVSDEKKCSTCHKK